MVNNYKIIEIIREYLGTEKRLELNDVSIKTIEYFFSYLVTHKNRFNTAYLLNYLYKNISNKEVAKRKTTARDFEDYLAIIFNGIITDEINRTNQNIQANNIFVENQFITNFVLSNRREKADIIFPNNYELSVKTLINSNQEINLGSFEKTALFYLLDVEDYLGERKGKEIVLKNSQTVKVGLGSKILLKNLLLYLEEINKFDIFQERFINMAKNIFSADFLIAIKNDLIMDLYFLPKEKFINLLDKLIIAPDLFLTVINRWEGNSIRVNREKILEVSNHIRLDFNFLEESILKDLEEFENTISQLLIFYINEKDKEKYKNKMFEELDNIVKILDQNMEELN